MWALDTFKIILLLDVCLFVLASCRSCKEKFKTTTNKYHIILDPSSTPKKQIY